MASSTAFKMYTQKGHKVSFRTFLTQARKMIREEDITNRNGYRKYCREYGLFYNPETAFVNEWVSWDHLFQR